MADLKFFDDAISGGGERLKLKAAPLLVDGRYTVIRMNRILTLAAITSLLGAATLCLNSRSSVTGSVSASPQTPATATRMEQIVQDSVSRKVFMGTVLVARGDEILLNKGYGFANLELNVPDTPPTKFRLGSVTKQFTAAAIMLLQERGKINVNDLVKKYIPDAPAAWDKITIFNILTHTAGIPNYTNFADYPALQAIPTTPQKLVARFMDKPLDFQPGEKYSYSNSGYIVLGYLVEKAQRGDLRKVSAGKHFYSPGYE